MEESPGVTPLPGSPPTPTPFPFCSSLYMCSSHGFSSLQSPSAFPSYSSDDFSQQLEPSSFEDTEHYSSLLPLCELGTSLDIEQEAALRSQDELSSQSLLSPSIAASEETIAPGAGSLFNGDMVASKHQNPTEAPSFLSRENTFPAYAENLPSCLFVSTPGLAQHPSPLLTLNANGMQIENRYASTPVVTIANGNDTECKDQTPKTLLKRSWANNSIYGPSDVFRFALAENIILEPSQEVKRDCKRAVLPVSKEVFSSPCSCKENLNPQSSRQQELEQNGGLKVDPGGWLCPRVAKTIFKPKPRQVLLDKWLKRQR